MFSAVRFESGFVTLVVRTPLIGYPDYVSLRIAEEGAEMARVTVYSRSRFGRRDFGANKTRVTRIFDELKATQ